MRRIVLGYSGGLDTSVAIRWLVEHYDAEVVAVTLDLGQRCELVDVRERALALGAVRAHVIDAREEFVRDYVLPSLQAGALYEDAYPLATALGRPLIARHLVQVARMEGATAIAHGCPATGNDQVRIEVSARALDPAIEIIAPARMWGMSLSTEIEYARSRQIPIPATRDGWHMVDANLWGRAIECGEVEDPWLEAPDAVYTLTRSARDCPDEPAFVDITFEAGVPVRVNGIDMPLIEMIESLETIAGAHGVGRVDLVENRLVGNKSRAVYEAPAAVVLHAAHRELEKLVVTRDLERIKHDLSRTYADLIYDGLWFSPARRAIDAFVASVQSRVTGSIRLRLFKGDSRVVGRRSPFALFDPAPATTADGFDHTAAAGFIRLWGLPIETVARKATGARERVER